MASRHAPSAGYAAASFSPSVQCKSIPLIFLLFPISATQSPNLQRGASTPAPTPSSDRYFDLMLNGLVHREGSEQSFVVRSLLHNKNHDGFAKCKTLGPTEFFSIGLEGAGHHLFEKLSPALCGHKKACGGQMSYPYGWAWRAGSLDVSTVMGKKGSSPEKLFNRGGKYLILMRDMVDCTASNLRRFWGRTPTRLCKRHLHLNTTCPAGAYCAHVVPPPRSSPPTPSRASPTHAATCCTSLYIDNRLALCPKFTVDPRIPIVPEGHIAAFASKTDTLQYELEVKVQAAARMNADLDKVNVQDVCSLVVNYDLLVRYPGLHTEPLARFLGVDPADPRIQHFLGRSIKSPAVSTSNRSRVSTLGVPALQMYPPSLSTTAAIGKLLLKSVSHKGFDPLGKFSGELAALPALCGGTNKLDTTPAPGVLRRTASADDLHCGLAWRRAWRQHLAHIDAAAAFPNVVPAALMTADVV